MHQVVLHGNMNGRPIFDALWMAGLFINTIAVLPQLWLVTKTGGRVEALTSHPQFPAAATNAPAWTKAALRKVAELEYEIERR